MTIAGLNLRIDIWRITFSEDDYVGGAVTTGTILYHDIQARIEQAPAQQLLLQQGLEIVKTFTVTLIPGTLDVHERDEIMIVEPSDHIYHNSVFRVVGVHHTDFNPRDPRNYLILYATRNEGAHTIQ